MPANPSRIRWRRQSSRRQGYYKWENNEFIEIKEYTPVTHLNDLKWWTARINEDNKYASVSLEYPQFIGGDEVKELNEYIRGTVLNVLYEDRNDVKEWIAKELWCKEYPGDAYGERVWECSVQLVSEYKVASIVNDIVSLELVLTDFTGGGNGNHDISYVVNWDLKNNRLLDDKDIFCGKEYPDDLVPLAYKNLYNASVDENTLLYLSKSSGIDAEITPPSFGEFGVLLGYHSLSIVFQPYAVISGAAGIVRVPIPYSDLEGKICI